MQPRSDSIFNRVEKEDLVSYLHQCEKFRQIDIKNSFKIALAAIKYYKGDLRMRDVLVGNQQLENKWYASLDAGSPDYSVYNDDHFISDVWACWVVYSRKYLLGLNSPKSLSDNSSVVSLLSPNVRSVIDLGCGFGYTTAGLKELFPHARVSGTNIENTFQFKLATELGKIRNFNITPEIREQTDLVFASEYFEHHQRPIDHLREVIRVGEPRCLILANAFGSRSVGHFNEYIYDDQKIPNTAIGRIFNKTLRDFGFTSVKTKLWNNRPSVWIR